MCPMIGYIEGEVKSVIRDTLVVATQGGVGYRLFVPTSILAKTTAEEHVALWTHLAVREKAHDLYGFETKDELAWFELLLSVSGIGPRSALSVMNSVPASSLATAITTQDPSLLAQAIGIGKKTAEKIVLELKDKVDAPHGEEAVGAHDGEVVEALVSLGYSTKEARDAARAISKDLSTPEEKIREALRFAAGTK